MGVRDARCERHAGRVEGGWGDWGWIEDGGTEGDREGGRAPVVDQKCRGPACVPSWGR